MSMPLICCLATTEESKKFLYSSIPTRESVYVEKMYWFAGFLGLCMIAAWPHVRHLNLESVIPGLDVARASCGDRFARNAILLSSGLCDRGTHELEMGELVMCDKARKETAWGMTACIVGARLADSTLLATISGSWVVTIGLLFLMATAIRAWFSSRAELQKHAMSIEAHQQMTRELHSATGLLLQSPPQGQHGWFNTKQEQWQRLRRY